MADFSQVNWGELIKLVSEVQTEVEAVKNAVSAEEKVTAIGTLAETFVSMAEALSGKDLVNNDAFRELVQDVVELMADVGDLKPVPPV